MPTLQWDFSSRVFRGFTLVLWAEHLPVSCNYIVKSYIVKDTHAMIKWLKKTIMDKFSQTIFQGNL